MNKWYLFFLGCTAFPLFLLGQDSVQLRFSAYGEVYYGLDFHKPPNHTRPSFVYSHNRKGEVNINLALIRTSFKNERTRANLGFMAGTYSNANLAAEPGVLKNIFEANVGVRISKRHQVWIDAGIMPSHIGFESAVGKDNPTLTRSIAADNSPYYEAGARFSYSSKVERWYAALLLLNGWQRIQRIDGNHTPALGTQLTYKPTNHWSINWSTYVGNEQPDSARKMRYFNNLYGVVNFSGGVSLTVGFDVGMEQKRRKSTSINVWYTPVLILRGKLSENKFVALRTEYYQDKGGVIITPVNNHSFGLFGSSLNFDWAIIKNFLWRTEAKWFKGSKPYFPKSDGTFVRLNTALTTAMCLSF